jgi:ectoine hydroxylase-related dioxygenase (phytanoyl-CoA dioxygenase family)
MIDARDIARFREDGFLLVPDVFSQAEVRRFRRAVDAAIAARGEAPPPMAERDAFDRMFTQHFNLWEDSEAVRALSFEPRLAQIASALLGASRVRVYCDQSFYKEPGSSETRPHQDYPLFSIAETDTVNAWVLLQHAGPEAGTIGYVRGSNHLGRVTSLDLALGRDPCAEEPLSRMLAEPIYLDVPLGGVVFHHVSTYHLARANHARRTRKALAVTYFADGATRGSAYPHASVDRAQIGVGEPIRGPGTPIAWPRRAPPPPPPPMPDPPRGWPGRSTAVSPGVQRRTKDA